MSKIIPLLLVADKYGHYPGNTKKTFFQSSDLKPLDYVWIVDDDVPDPDCDDKFLAFAGDKGDDSVAILSTKTLKIKAGSDYIFAQVSKVQLADLRSECCTTGNVPPVVTLAVDDDDISSGTASAFTATPTDSDGTITKVEFWEGETKLGEDASSSGGYTLSTTLAKGVHFVVAKAIDNAGGFAYSAWQRVIVR